jgi:transcriptional regulator with XRE-family HTH domain
MDPILKFGRRVKKLRKEAHLSQEELAFRADMKRSYLSDLENGKRNPSVRALIRLATGLEVPPAHLLEE